MALYADLSQEDKDVLSAWERNTRGWVNSLMRLVAEARALDAARQATGGAQSILDSLDAGQEVPNSSGIAGAQDLTKAEWATLIAGLSGFLSSYDSLAIRKVASKAAGPVAGL